MGDCVADRLVELKLGGGGAGAKSVAENGIKTAKQNGSDSPVADPLFLPNGERCAYGTEEEEKRYEEALEECALLAKKAVAFYNRRPKKKKDPVYVLVKPMLICQVTCLRQHFNFLARPKNSAADSPPTLFYAEVEGEEKFTCLRPLPLHSITTSAGNSSAGISYGCRLCSPHDSYRIYHPPDGTFPCSGPYIHGLMLSCSSSDDEDEHC